ncbi:ataxin-7-like, partial [Anoplopoma fimbria]|uniref:ataxin-7-like n=1 Tax=Anoplopoma fimbria TaxID=229290 RepID=UPI0023EBA647
MPIFGQCPAQDDFYLVMCSQCSQVVKPQAFQAHYEKTQFGQQASLNLPLPSVGQEQDHPSSSNPKLLKPAKEKLPAIQRRTPFAPFRTPQLDKILTPAVKVEKMHLRVDTSAKLVQAPSAPATTSSSSASSSSTTVSSNTTTITTSSSSSSALKPGLNCPSIPKPSLPAPGPIPNGKGHLSVLPDKKQDSSSSASSRRHLNKKLTEREFNADIHCGVVDMTARKPCTRSLTCK